MHELVEEFFSLGFAPTADGADFRGFLQFLPIMGSSLDRFLNILIGYVEAGADNHGVLTLEFAFSSLFFQILVDGSAKCFVAQH